MSDTKVVVLPEAAKIVDEVNGLIRRVNRLQEKFDFVRKHADELIARRAKDECELIAANKVIAEQRACNERQSETIGEMMEREKSRPLDYDLRTKNEHLKARVDELERKNRWQSDRIKGLETQAAVKEKDEKAGGLRFANAGQSFGHMGPRKTTVYTRGNEHVFNAPDQVIVQY